MLFIQKLDTTIIAIIHGRSMQSLRLLVLFLGSTGALRLAAVPLRGQLLTAHAAVRMAAVDECVVDAESAAEAGDCAQPMAAGSASTAPPKVAKSEAERRAGLMGSADSLQTCLSEAEDGTEAEDCVLDYDELVSGGGGDGEKSPMDFALPAVAAIVLLGGAATLLS